jgi:hypothetical protein
MAGKQGNPVIATTPPSKQTGGGTAAGGGISFQAVATAIVAVHILRGAAMGWLYGVCKDLPFAVWAESEGPGDDLRIELANDLAVEVQAKKGLTSGPNLWAALLSLAQAIHHDYLPYGILVVAGDSSRTIRKDLAKDIVRLGQGRNDSLTKIGTEWADKLRAANIPVAEVCRRIRIRVLHTDSAADPDVHAAQEMLRSICVRESDALQAWNALCHHAVTLIEKRGRWALRDLVLLLRSIDIDLRVDDSPASVLDRQSKWIVKTNGHFSITGARCKLPLVHLLPMQLERIKFKRSEPTDASTALERYRKSTERDRYGEVLDSIWIARFRTLVVVEAGPGLGKTTMITELAHQYAIEGYRVLKVALRPIAAAMGQGGVFSELLLDHALSGSGISPVQIRSSAHSSWVILADGLDECGSAHDEVAKQLNRFAQGHPHARIVVTTRTIGYDTVELADWAHYRLLPPVSAEGASNLMKLVRAVSSVESPDSKIPDLTPYQIEQATPSDAISINPLLLGMSASLILRRRALPRTALELYSHLIGLFEERPVNVAPAQIDVHVVLNIMGWILLTSPLITYDQLIERATKILASLMVKPAMVLKQDVRLAVDHWERVGLVEKVHHDGTKLLTFIHKTLCEFVASRFLICDPQNLLEAVIDQPGAQEAIKFGTGQGMADELIALYLRRHLSGRSHQLQPALALLGNPEIVVSGQRTDELIKQSWKAIDEGILDRFSIGVALADVGARASYLMETDAGSRLDATDPAVKLVAWATAVSCGFSRFEVSTIVTALRSLLPSIKPFSVREAISKQDRSDRDLIVRIALGALKAQPDDQARLFTEELLADLSVLTWDFRIQANLILISRGLESLPALFPKDEKPASPVSLFPAGVGWMQDSLCAFRVIAKALANDGVPISVEPTPNRDLPQFAGMLTSSGFNEMPMSDLSIWEQDYDEVAVWATIRTIAALIPLDLGALAAEAKDVVRWIDTGECTSLFDHLPRVDVPEPSWEKVKELRFDHMAVKRALLHPSNWLSLLAAQICMHLPMAQDELEMLLDEAKDHALLKIVALIFEHHVAEAIPMVVRRLNRDATGDLSGIFDLLLNFNNQPTVELISATLRSLLSEHGNTRESATNLLSQWIDQGYSIDRASVAKAVDHWHSNEEQKGRPSPNVSSYYLVQLLEKIDLNAL